jgi:1-deoxy-D-xylulose-5-phosphate synthase
VGKFDPVSGEILSKGSKSFSDTFGETMCALASENDRLCAITAAMPGGTGLLKFKETYPDRLFDVGIAEEHATSMAGGLAKQGMTPVLALYSTFLQRSYDQILQDIAMLNLHVVLAVDRAGLVGEDGETHHGVFDIGFLRQAPGMTILCPGSCAELSKMLTWAVNDHNGPVAVRYPRGGDRGFTQSHWTDLDTPVSCHRKGKDMTILTYGTMLDNAMQAADILSQRGIEATVLRLMAVAPLNVDAIASQIAGSHLLIVEEANTHSGIAKELAFRMSEQNHSYKVHALDLGDGYVTHGSLDSLYRHYGLDGVSIAEFIQKEHFYENQKAPGCALDGAPVHGFPS